MIQEAIIDTSVLISLYQLNLLTYLKFFYSKVYIPKEVESEFLNKIESKNQQTERLDFLLRFYQKNSSWCKKCFL